MNIRVALLVCLLAASSTAEAADYYVSAGGANTNAGTTPWAPWRTLARVTTVDLRAGDRVLLRAGDTFFGGLAIDSRDAGTAASPIVITTYGTGRAAIWAGTGTGISIYNTSGISIANSPASSFSSTSRIATALRRRGMAAASISTRTYPTRSCSTTTRTTTTAPGSCSRSPFPAMRTRGT